MKKITAKTMKALSTKLIIFGGLIIAGGLRKITGIDILRAVVTVILGVVVIINGMHYKNIVKKEIEPTRLLNIVTWCWRIIVPIAIAGLVLLWPAFMMTPRIGTIGLWILIVGIWTLAGGVIGIAVASIMGVIDMLRMWIFYKK